MKSLKEAAKDNNYQTVHQMTNLLLNKTKMEEVNELRIGWMN